MKGVWSIVVVALLALAAQAEQFAWKANFVQTNPDKFGNGFVKGTMYYRYDTANTKTAVVRYDVTSPTTITIMKVQADKRVYKKCTKCEGANDDSLVIPDLHKLSSDSCGLNSGKYECTRKVNGITLTLRFKSASETSKPVSFTYGKDTYELTNQGSYTFSSSTFTVPESWDCGHCVSMVDLFFLLDGSDSLTRSDWSKQVDFVNKVVSMFTLGEKATAVSIISWHWVRRVAWPLSTTRYLQEISATTIPYETFALVPPYTVGKYGHYPDYPYENTGGATHQYMGFKEMIDQLNQNSTKVPGSSRRIYTKGKMVPTPIAIAVTDGYDHSQQRGLAWSQMFKDVYKGFVIEVGVGSSLSFGFMKQMASEIAGERAVYTVGSFSGLKDIVDKVVKVSCDYGNSTEMCDAGCYGFCGCDGKCFCPECEQTTTKCREYKCTSNGVTASKCVETQPACLKDVNKCWTPKCDAATGTCTREYTQCYKPKVPGTNKECMCAQPFCLDGCRYNQLDSKCPHVNCYVNAKCDCSKAGTFADKYPGCVYTPKTCKASVPCMTSTCNTANDLCQETQNCAVNSDKCFRNTCNTTTGKCDPIDVRTNLPHHECLEYKCKDGVVTEQPRDCAKEANDPDPCHAYTCSKDKCSYTEIEGCKSCGSMVCDDRLCMDTSCREDSSGQTVCHYEPKENNCTRGMCETGKCDESTGGECVYTPDCPDDSANFCKRTECVGPHKCEWVPREGVCSGDGCNINGRCVDDATGACEYDSPCVKNKCENVTCTVDKETGKGVCNYTEYKGCTVQAELSKCMYSVCDPATDTCVVHDIDCDDHNYCTIDSCDLSSGCVHTKEYDNETCTLYFCNSSEADDTKRWTSRGKCDDFNFCTIDTCDENTGECSYRPNMCEELSLEGYICFTRKCIRSQSRCMRRLVEGAYIDICGNCITAENAGASSYDEAECLDGIGVNPVVVGVAGGVVAGIVIAVVVAVAAVTAGSIYGTKELMKRARNAADQGAQMNPLYEDSKHEASNPFYEEGGDKE